MNGTGPIHNQEEIHTTKWIAETGIVKPGLCRVSELASQQTRALALLLLYIHTNYANKYIQMCVCVPSTNRHIASKANIK